MELSSPAFDDDGVIPDRHVRGLGEGEVSPPLRWSGVPSTTNSFAIVCVDADAEPEPVVHWLLGGVQAERDGLDEGEAPDGTIAGRNDHGLLGYRGPDAEGRGSSHRYVFRLHALAEPLELKDGSSKEEFFAAIDRAVLETAELVGRYPGGPSA